MALCTICKKNESGGGGLGGSVCTQCASAVTFDVLLNNEVIDPETTLDLINEVLGPKEESEVKE